jgi:hypothetical protein
VFIGDNFPTWGSHRGSVAVFRTSGESAEAEHRQGPDFLLQCCWTRRDRSGDRGWKEIIGVERQSWNFALRRASCCICGDLLAMQEPVHERDAESQPRIAPISPTTPCICTATSGHLSKPHELTEASRDVVTSLMEMYLSMLNNQMAQASNEMNATVRRLTFITTIFMPLSLLAGIGGMSEWTMMTGAQNWRIAYPAFMLGMVVIGIANYFLLKWLERRGKNRLKA